MHAFYHPAQRLHAPKQFMRAGRISAPTDVPERTDAILRTLEARGVEVHEPVARGLEGAAAVHTPGYLNFLSTAFQRWMELDGAGIEVLPNTFPYWNARPECESRGDCPSGHIVAEAGFYLGDLAVPLGPDSWRSMLAATHVATAAADHVLGGGPSAYALCRPSGHHARTDRASGFCYLNNTAITAQRLRRGFERVAILDIDAHHGDGTQAIFYRRADVLTISIHADPANYYPFFTGYASETGYGEGLGTNINVPLPAGAGNDELTSALASSIQQVRKFGATALVVALGFDSHRDDPIGVLDVSSDGFRRFGEMIAGLQLPTVVVQEGGYELSVIGDCLSYFLDGFEEQ